MITHYEALGIAPRAPLAEIQRAHRRLAAQFHPDLHPGDRAAQERFKAIQRAYDILSDESRRRAYDEHLQRALEGKAERWLARALGGWRASATRYRPRRSWYGWRPLHLAAAAIAACVLVGSAIALVVSDGPLAHDPLATEPALVTADDDANPNVENSQPAVDRVIGKSLPVTPAAVEVSNPSPRDLYREPTQP
jgi:hypothetical protein